MSQPISPSSQVRVTIPNLPGELARVTAIVRKAKANILGMMTESLGDISHVRILVDRSGGLGELLEHAGYPVVEAPVYSVRVPNRPGQIDDLARKLAEEQINILCIYGTAEGATARFVLAVDPVEKAGHLIAKWQRRVSGRKQEKEE